MMRLTFSKDSSGCYVKKRLQTQGWGQGDQLQGWNPGEG